MGRSENSGDKKLSVPCALSEPLDERFRNNEGIREVHEMLQEFVKNKKLMELYRQCQERIDNERAVDRKYMEDRKKLAAEISLRKKAEAELKEKERCSVLALRKAGYEDRDIAGLLGIPEKRVKAVREK
jgi:hypothetical protein